MLRKAEAICEGQKLTICQQWTPLQDISPNLIHAVIESEDARFYEHRGFDAEAIMNAWLLNQRYGMVRYGGSTISQQTAKNVFCSPARTWIRKAFEAYFTVLIELFWGKDRIMEVYLNVVELGDGIFGADAAADYYYARSATSLTQSQANQLAMMLPHPR